MAGTDVEAEFGGTWFTRELQPAIAREIERYGLSVNESVRFDRAVWAGTDGRVVGRSPGDTFAPLFEPANQVMDAAVERVRRAFAAGTEIPPEFDVPAAGWIERSGRAARDAGDPALVDGGGRRRRPRGAVDPDAHRRPRPDGLPPRGVDGGRRRVVRRRNRRARRGAGSRHPGRDPAGRRRHPRGAGRSIRPCLDGGRRRVRGRRRRGRPAVELPDRCRVLTGTRSGARARGRTTPRGTFHEGARRGRRVRRRDDRRRRGDIRSRRRSGPGRCPEARSSPASTAWG